MSKRRPWICCCGHRQDDHWRISDDNPMCARVTCSCRKFIKLTRRRKLINRMERWLSQ